MENEAIILAGGFGTRLRSVVTDLPKPMADVNGKPFLYFLLESLNNQNFSKVVLSVGYKHESIIQYFGKQFKQMTLDYAIEDSPLGTGGAIQLALEKIGTKKCFVLNGDTYFNIDFRLLTQTDALCTIAGKTMFNFDRYGTIEADNDKVVCFNEKKPMEKGIINGGVYYLDSDIFKAYQLSKFSFENEVLPELAQKKQLKLVTFDSYFMDIGIPEDYKQFQHDIKNNIQLKH